MEPSHGWRTFEDSQGSRRYVGSAQAEAQVKQMQRISIIGTSAAGKSTLARELSGVLGVPHVELDGLYWEPGWVAAPKEVFRERVTEAVATAAWVIDGNYSGARDLVWDRCDTVVWLDYSFATVLGRGVWRTFRRVVLGERCCNGNREEWWRALSRDSIVWWIVTTYHRRRREFAERMPELEGRGVQIVRHRTPRETRAWLDALRREESQTVVVPPGTAEAGPPL